MGCPIMTNLKTNAKFGRHLERNILKVSYCCVQAIARLECSLFLVAIEQLPLTLHRQYSLMQELEQQSEGEYRYFIFVISTAMTSLFQVIWQICCLYSRRIYQRDKRWSLKQYPAGTSPLRLKRSNLHLPYWAIQFRAIMI